jgi:phosphoribosylamine--glycine ligase
VKILVIGSGAREHAIVNALLRDSAAHEIVVAPGNAGIADVVETVSLNTTDGTLIAEYASEQNIELVIVGPEAPLVAGVADELRTAGIPVFGPDKAAARLEGSKDFAKEVMNAARVPTGRSVSATTMAEVESALDEFGAPYVVKADGLAAGKGVIVTTDRKAAHDHAEFFIHQGAVLIEEFLDGHEVSLFVLSGGDAVVPLSPAQDYKRAFDNDEGPNTGGMGAYSPLPWLPEGFVDEVVETVAQPTIREMSRRGTPFVGLLYCGLIVTTKGVRVIEFNARFGDPETQVVLANLRTPLGHLLMAAATGSLSAHPPLAWNRGFAVTVVMAAHGYPVNARSGDVIHGLGGRCSGA